jgi:hypothetical protein
MLAQTAEPSARRGVHPVFAGEKVREYYAEPAPELGSVNRVRGIPLIPLADLVRMKLTSFRARDEAHLKDLDEAGLIAGNGRGPSSAPARAAGTGARAGLATRPASPFDPVTLWS